MFESNFTIKLACRLFVRFLFLISHVAYTALKNVQHEGKSLCVAAKYGHIDIVNLLLEKKVDINSVDIDQVRVKQINN